MVRWWWFGAAVEKAEILHELQQMKADGIGGADRSRGSGLVGLTDRVEALGGSISIESPPGAGTRITAELPLELEVREEP